MPIFTTILSASNGVYTTGSIETSKPDGTADVRVVRDDSSVTAGDKIGRVSFLAHDGAPGTLPLSGAYIEATAAGSWLTADRQPTNLHFSVQDNTTNVDVLPQSAFILSGSDRSVGFDVGVRAARVQVGVSTDEALSDNDDALLRVSSKLESTGIDIDPESGAGKYGFIRFTNNGNTSTNTAAIFVESNPSVSNDKFKIGRWSATGDHLSAIAIHSNANSVRIGGGSHGNSNDTNASLIVTGSSSGRKSILRVASRHQTRTLNNYPAICLDYKGGSGNNTGTWWIAAGNELVQNQSMVPLRIGAAAAATSNAPGIVSAMTFARGGADARVGVGGSNVGWPGSSVYPRSMDPTGSFHIETLGNSSLGLTSTLDASQLLLGNSNGAMSPVFSEVSFDVSTDFNKNKRTAAITAVRDASNADSDAHKGKLHIRLDDGSGNTNSTRTRMRIDDQGGILIFSGTHVQAGGGYPNVRDANMQVGDNYPSGSLTLIAQGGLANAKSEVIPTLNFALYTGTTDTDTSRDIRANDSLGRIQWWSNDNNLTSESERVSAYIDVKAPVDHSATNKSPGQMSFYVRNSAGVLPEEAIRLDANGDLIAFKDIHALGGKIKDLTGDTALALPGNGRVQVSNNFSGIVAEGLSVDNTNNTLNSGGFIQLSKTAAGILNGGTLGGVLFSGADTGVSSTPNVAAKILSKTVEPWAHGSAQGSEIQFHTTQPGTTSALQTATISRSGITGSVGGIKMMAGNIDLPAVDAVIRNGQVVSPAILLSNYATNDVSIFRVDAGGANTQNGFTLVYSGSGSGQDNKLELWADNTSTGDNLQTPAYSVDNAGNMYVPALISDGVIGTDPEDSSTDSLYNPNNPSVTIAGRRESLNAFCFLTKADAATNGVKKIIPLNNLGTGEQTFASYDQQPEQTRFAFVAPSDGYIESIQFLSDHMWGTANLSGQKHEINFYKQGSTSISALSGLSPFITMEFWYGYATIPSVILHAGKVTHIDTASRSSAAFSAGDKIYMSFQGKNNDANYRDVTGAASTSACSISINVNFVFDDRNLDT